MIKIAVLCSLALLSAADMNAHKTVQKELDYFNSLSQKSIYKVLSGQFIGWLGNEDPQKFQKIYKLSGHYPAIMSGNYADFGNNIFVFFSTNSQLIEHWNNGGLVEVGIHFNNPMNNKWDLTEPVDFKKLIQPGTEDNARFNAQLDRICIGLNELQQAGIVTLFRPFVETNGNWFWWNGKPRQEFIDLWKYTFNYITNIKQLHNLLWVYSVSAGYGNALYYYPGDDFVDIVGLDYYSSTGQFYNTEEYQDLLTTKKSVALSEVGQCRSSGYNCKPEDSCKIINSIKQFMPAIIYWSNWNDVWSLENQLNLAELMSNEWVVNRGNIEFRKLME